jgi:hypothetical protein
MVQHAVRPSVLMNLAVCMLNKREFEHCSSHVGLLAWAMSTQQLASLPSATVSDLPPTPHTTRGLY